MTRVADLVGDVLFGPYYRVVFAAGCLVGAVFGVFAAVVVRWLI